MKIKIGNKLVGEGEACFIIAEVGVNYYDIAKKENIKPIEAAKLMIKEAAKAGADAVKFQTYKAEKIASKYSPAYWDTDKEPTKSQYVLFKKYDKFEEEEYRELARYSKEEGIVFMSTPFDEGAVDFLDVLVPVFKISSSDITNIPFIKYIAQKGKPIFLSTGASTVEEIEDAINAIKEGGDCQIVLMHCILSYPTKYEDCNLNMIKHLKVAFPEHIIGYSDHALPDSDMSVLTTAVLLGAKVVEKHFTLDKSLPGNDHFHAMDPKDLRKFIGTLGRMKKILGKEKKEPIVSELPARSYARRSIVANADIPKGTILTRKMITFKRPGTGIAPKFIDAVVGRETKTDIKEDTAITWDNISKERIK